jgi:glutamyl-Q tRNA(Asp) synthetase
MTTAPVIGRFAPSPTGDLHFGSLVAAVGSYLATKSVGGLWLLRVEDIDPPREVEGSARRIISDLEWLGMRPDTPVLYQSSRLGAYQAALQRLLEAGLAYPCGCSRSDLPASGIYPGTCRGGIPGGRKARSIRFRVDADDGYFDDRVQGRVRTAAASSGDFVIRRADGLFAYQLAVVVDDAFQRVTEVVRGADLLESSQRQICLQKALGLPQPAYAHLPLAVDAQGGKLSKRAQADPFRHGDPVRSLRAALEFLGQHPPAAARLDNLWQWAIANWRWERVPRCPTLEAGDGSAPATTAGTGSDQV